jgi:SAM-dependent methyltransferase
MSEYKSNLEKQLKNLENPAIDFFYKTVFEAFLAHIDIYGEYLEVGAGAGGSERFLKNINVTRTDYLVSIPNKVKGGVNIEELPYESGLFNGVFAIDTIHHLNDPERGFLEILRVCKVGGKIYILEPYVSLSSFFFYKVFHDEEVSFAINPEKLRGVVDSSADSGNQGIMQALMKSRIFIDLIDQSIIDIDFLKIFAPFSFYATGGIKKPLNTPMWVIKKLMQAENRFPKSIMKLLASRQILIITKSR